MRACVMRALKPQWSEALTLLACSKATLLCWSVLAHLGLTSQQVADLQLLLPLLNLLNSYQHCRGIADHQGTDVNQVVLVYIFCCFQEHVQRIEASNALQVASMLADQGDLAR